MYISKISLKCNKINRETGEAKNIRFEVKNLRKVKYSDFRSFAKFETRNIPYISKLSCQNRLKNFDSNYNQISDYDYGMQGLSFN